MVGRLGASPNCRTHTQSNEMALGMCLMHAWNKRSVAWMACVRPSHLHISLLEIVSRALRPPRQHAQHFIKYMQCEGVRMLLREAPCIPSMTLDAGKPSSSTNGHYTVPTRAPETVLVGSHDSQGWQSQPTEDVAWSYRFNGPFGPTGHGIDHSQVTTFAHLLATGAI